MRSLTILIGLILLSSCVTQRKCLRKFPIISDTVRVVIIKDTVIYRDTLVTIQLPGDTIEVEQNIDSLLLPILADHLKPLIAENNYVKAVFEVYKNKIRLVLTQKETTFNVKLDSVIKQEKYWKEQYDTVTKIVIKKEVPTIYKVGLWFSIGALVILVLGFLRLLKR